MRGNVTEMPQREQPLSERFRIAANAWVDADARARRLEELKTTMLEQHKANHIMRHGAMPDNRAEREVKSAPEWQDYIEGMVEARTIANRLKVEMEVLRMMEREISDRNQTIRAEMRLARG